MTRASAVATSRRRRAPSEPMPTAASAANTPRPSSVLRPSQKAPAAPANAPFGMAWAAKESPRTTTKKPTTPATTATTVAAAHALAMNPENMAPLPPAQPPAGHERDPAAHVEDDVDGDDEEADREAVAGRAPRVAVVREEDPEPGGGDAERRRDRDGRARAAGEPQCGGGRADQQRRREDGADGQGGEADGHRQGEHEQRADNPHGDAPSRCRLGAERAEQQRPVGGRDEAQSHHAAGHDDGHRPRIDGEDGPEQDLLGRAVDGVRRRVEVEEERGAAGGRAEDDAGGDVTPPRPLGPEGVHAERAEDAAAEEAGQRAEPEQQRARAAGGGHV